MPSRDSVPNRPPMTSSERRGWAAIDPTQHTYLAFVAYFDAPPSTTEVSRAFVATTKFLVRNLKSRGTLARVTQDPRSKAPADPRWGPRQLGTIEISGFTGETCDELDQLLGVPDDAATWSSYSDIYGAKVPATQAGWLMTYARAEPPNPPMSAAWDDRCVMMINTKLLPPAQWKGDRLRRLVEFFFDTWSQAFAPYFGHVHVESEDDTKAGFYYKNHVIAEYPEHRQINHWMWWAFTDDRPLRARGVYWGNYWGPKLARKVGRERLDDFLAYTLYDGEPQTRYVTNDRHGGVFIGMSGDPTEVKPLQQFGGLLANTLHRMIVLHRLLRCADAIL